MSTWSLVSELSAFSGPCAKKAWRREFPAVLREVGPCLAWIEAIARTSRLSDDQTYAILLCAEELVTNIVRHNPPETAGAAPLCVAMSLQVEEDRVILTIEDNGVAFDVVQAPTKQIEPSIDLLEPGGLGVGLVKRFASNLQYFRTQTGNKVVASFITECASAPDGVKG